MPQNLRQLTALRFFAALWVVLFDYWGSSGFAMPTALSKGYLGVELFFVLSGFILCHVYLERFGEGGFRYADFLWARLARIYPVHLATLTVMGLLVAAAAFAGVQVGDRVVQWSSLPAELTLTHAWGLGMANGWNHPSWSISAEWFAYLSFPLFAIVAWTMRDRPRLALGLALILIVALNLGFERIAGFPLTRATIAWGALRIVPCFAYGSALWLAWRAELVTRSASGGCLALTSLFAIVASAGYGAPDAITIGLFGGLILGLGVLARHGSRRMANGVLVYLGEVSFSIYMVCIPWKLVFGRAVDRLFHTGAILPPWLWGLQLAGVLAAAMVLHHLVERPAREIMRRHGTPFRRRSAGGRLADALALSRP